MHLKSIFCAYFNLREKQYFELNVPRILKTDFKDVKYSLQESHDTKIMFHFSLFIYKLSFIEILLYSVNTIECLTFVSSVLIDGIANELL